MNDRFAISPLFCKDSAPEILYQKRWNAVDSTIAFRSLDLDKDLDLVHTWVNMDYTRVFWQMRGSIGLLRSCYQCILQNPFAHSFIGLLDADPICLFDLYKVSADELSRHVSHEDQDCGFHLCMAPLEKPVHGLTPELIKAFLEYYFSQGPSGCMFAEPDIKNLKSIQLLERAGFERIKTVDMSYKTAHIYKITKNVFLCQE